jgi:hypothetical protein
MANGAKSGQTPATPRLKPAPNAGHAPYRSQRPNGLCWKGTLHREYPYIAAVPEAAQTFLAGRPDGAHQGASECSLDHCRLPRMQTRSRSRHSITTPRAGYAVDPFPTPTSQKMPCFQRFVPWRVAGKSGWSKVDRIRNPVGFTARAGSSPASAALRQRWSACRFALLLGRQVRPDLIHRQVSFPSRSDRTGDTIVASGRRKGFLSTAVHQNLSIRLHSTQGPPPKPSPAVVPPAQVRCTPPGNAKIDSAENVIMRLNNVGFRPRR